MTAAILSQIWRYSVYTVRHRAKRLERELRLGNRVGGALPVTSQAPLDLTLPKGREIGSRGFGAYTLLFSPTGGCVVPNLRTFGI
jgi:hypothetical protein